MNVKQLKEILAGLNPEDDNLEVFIQQTNDEFFYSLAELIGPKEIDFMEAGERRILAKDRVLVITDNYLMK